MARIEELADRYLHGVISAEEQAELAAFAFKLGYRFAPGSLNIEFREQCEEWRFVCTAMENYKGQTLTRFSSRLNELHGLSSFKVTHARN